MRPWREALGGVEAWAASRAHKGVGATPGTAGGGVPALTGSTAGMVGRCRLTL